MKNVINKLLIFLSLIFLFFFALSFAWVKGKRSAQEKRIDIHDQVVDQIFKNADNISVTQLSEKVTLECMTYFGSRFYSPFEAAMRQAFIHFFNDPRAGLLEVQYWIGDERVTENQVKLTFDEWRVCWVRDLSLGPVKTGDIGPWRELENNFDSSGSLEDFSKW
jgi:hypothetical protein